MICPAFPLLAAWVPSLGWGVTLHLHGQGWKVGAEHGADWVGKALGPAAAAGMAPQGWTEHTTGKISQGISGLGHTLVHFGK